MAIIVDTGPLYALADADDQQHRAVAKFVAATRETLIVPSPVVPEVCYLLTEYLSADAEIKFLQSGQSGIATRAFHYKGPAASR